MNYIAELEEKAGCGPLLQRDRPNPAPLRQQIFEQVRAAGQTARADITRSLQISAGSATTQTADLIACGILREVTGPAREDYGRGRPPVALEVVPEAAYVIGIKLAFHRHSAVLSDFAGQVVAQATLPAPDARRGTNVLLDEITALIAQLMQTADMPLSRVKAVGIGLPGIVDQDSGVIIWSSLLKDSNVALQSDFAARFDMTLLLDNDTNMLTLSELWFGVGRDKTDFAVVTIENGVGMGLVVDNALYRGTHGVGLELGHTKVQLDGALCRCGQRGCLEAYLGDYALIREAMIALDPDVADRDDPKDVLNLLFEQAKAGNAAAEIIYRRAGRFLSVGLSNVVQLFDPPLIILSCARTQHDFFFTDEVFEQMHMLTLSNGRQPCEIIVHPWDDFVWARGGTAACLAALTDTMVGGAKVPSP
ncbi:MAG: ROK family protein [Yoonia sp.]|uniref:ROK family protein n=1 Tax=Yoonia sp. TaxID=2212373 RepID=UPI003EF5DA27